MAVAHSFRWAVNSNDNTMKDENYTNTIVIRVKPKIKKQYNEK